jgi:diacylglycerol kinase (ATP)
MPPASTPSRIAVVLRRGKSFGGGRRELRKLLREAGHAAPEWYELSHSGEVREAIAKAEKRGADLLFVWGGDGLVQRSIDTLVERESEMPIAILPAGTGNLLARHFEIPQNVREAVDIGLRGRRMRIDVGEIEGERFAVMAGCGVDALTMASVSKKAKKQLGALAYVRSGVRAVHAAPTHVRVRVDGKNWFDGEASCVLVGNIGEIQGGLRLFPEASPTDGKLELAVVTACKTSEWARVFTRIATGHPGRSPFVRMTRGKKITVKHDTEAGYERDGGAREPTKKLHIQVLPKAITLCVPRSK